MNPLLDFNNIGETEIEAVTKALREGQISTKGRYVDKFEAAIKEYFGFPYILATNSGTAALHLALLLHKPASRAGLKRVTIPDLSFVATRNAALMAGMDVNVEDVDLDSWCLPLQSPRTVSIPVHLYGVWPEHFNEADIHDAAEAFGSSHLVGRMAMYSFNGNKTITTSGGGLLLCRTLAEYTEAKAMMTPVNESDVVAYNYRMTSLAAAVGLGQLSRLDELLARKVKIHSIYRNELPMLTFQKGKGIRWMTACLFDKGASVVQEMLTQRGIPTRRVFKPFLGLPNATRIYEHGLCLPSSTVNMDEEIKDVCEVIKRIL